MSSSAGSDNSHPELGDNIDSLRRDRTYTLAVLENMQTHFEQPAAANPGLAWLSGAPEVGASYYLTGLLAT